MIKQLNKTGFTFIELMIAISVLSVVLVMATTVLISIGGLYTKGINVATLNNTNRNLVADLSAAIQFSGNTYGTGSMGGAQSYCIGKVRYSYVTNRELVDGVTPHVLWRDTMKSTALCQPMTISGSSVPDDGITSGDGAELMPNHTRLTKLDLTSLGNGTVLLSTSVAYGADDLLVHNMDGSWSCSGQKGTQYCAISNISTALTRRLE